MTTTTTQLPPPGFPMLTRMISNPLFPEKNGREEPVTWTVSLPHPLVPDMRVIRMFIDESDVAVYSVSADGKNGMRNIVPMSSVRLIEEAMPLDVFVDELADAEGSSDDSDDEVTPPPPSEHPTVAPAPNGSS